MTTSLRPDVPLRAVLFDLDGTLTDSEHLIVEGVVAAAALRGHTIDPVRLLVVLGPPAVETLTTHFNLPVKEAEAIGRVYQEHFDEWYLPRLTPMPGAGVLLAALHDQGVRLGLVTNKLEALGVAAVHRLGWQGRFDVVVGADTAQQPKPAPAPALQALRLLDCPPERAALVGDMETDMRCGQAAAMSWVIGLTTNRDAATLQATGATHICDTLPQVAAILLPEFPPRDLQKLFGQA